METRRVRDGGAFAPRPADTDAASRLSRELGLHPVTAQVLSVRGIRDPAQARRYLAPGPGDLRAPSLLRDMDRATEALARALDRGVRIAVYGDYDVDGVCATTVAVRALRAFGADVVPFVPHRVQDGYGLNPEALERLRARGCGLILTVDNGVTRADVIEQATSSGLEVVVTDHHEPAERLPTCPLVNPKRPDATYPFKGLAGCGVALKVVLGLAERLGRTGQGTFKALLPDLLALTAVGTVADVVPLCDENRALVAMGLKALAGTPHAGLRALVEVAGCTGRALHSSDVAYRIGPRINAAGRLGSADLALDLLLCGDDAERAADLAEQLDAANRERQQVERRQAEEAFEQAAGFLERGDAPALVLAGEGWHPGVIGIVAARVAETYRVPAVLVSVEGELGRGSARCFGDVRLHEALARCGALLESHGGHAKAAGFTMKADRLERFRAAFLDAVLEQERGDPGPREVAAELPVDAITLPFAAELERLAPFGFGNEEPLFCARGVRAAGRPRRVGPGERHLLFYAAGLRTAVRAVAPCTPRHEELLQGAFDLSFRVRRRDGPDPVELRVDELAPTPGPPAR